MTSLAWPEPGGEPLNQISPSAFSVLLTCPKRLAFQRDPRTKDWVARSTRTALGRVAHRLTELVARGAAPPPPDRKAWLEAQWEALVQQENLLIEQAWPDRQVPAPKDWPGYVATRVRLIRRLADLPAERVGPPARGNARKSTGKAALPWVERYLEDKPTRLCGAPDRVEIRDGRIRVVDLKSGVGQAGVSEDQQRQLLIYAHLVLTAYGSPPNDVVIQDVRGREEKREVERGQVEQTVVQANEAIDSFNEMLDTGHVDARPSPETCMWCPFRVVCADYWKSRNDAWPRLDVRGVVVEAVGRDSVRLELSSELSGSTSFRLLLTPGVQAELGDEVVAVDLERAGPATGRMRWNSRIRSRGQIQPCGSVHFPGREDSRRPSTAGG